MQRTLFAICQAILAVSLVYGQPAAVKRAIFDPILKRNAFYVSVPANWKFQGAVMPGSGCMDNPMPVYRASSPDGLTGVYMLPRVDWSWMSGAISPPPGKGCLPLKQRISARQYLTTLLPMLQVGFVREVDTEKLAAQAKQNAAESNSGKGAPNTTYSFDMARFLVRYEVSGHPVEEYVEALVNCSDQYTRLGNFHVYKCNVWVDRQRAPLGKLQEATPALRSVIGNVDPQWSAQWMQAWTQSMNATMAVIGPQILAYGKMAGDARTRQHQEFMQRFQEAGDARQYAFEEGQYRKQHATDNFVDYILDCTRLSNNVSVGGICESRQTAPFPQ